MIRNRLFTIVTMSVLGLGMVAGPSTATPAGRAMTVYADLPYAAAQPPGSR